MSDIPHMKLMVVGRSRCGKTSLIDRYASNKYIENRKPANAPSDPSMEETTKTISWNGEQKTIILMCRNTSQRIKLTNFDFQVADCFIVLYDQSLPSSLEGIANQLRTLKMFSNDRPVPVLIVAGKCDLGAEVDEQEAQEFAEDQGIPLMTASAKTGEGVNAVFEWCLEQVMRKPDENTDANNTEEENTQSKTMNTCTCTVL